MALLLPAPKHTLTQGMGQHFLFLWYLSEERGPHPSPWLPPLLPQPLSHAPSQVLPEMDIFPQQTASSPKPDRHWEFHSYRAWGREWVPQTYLIGGSQVPVCLAHGKSLLLRELRVPGQAGAHSWGDSIVITQIYCQLLRVFMLETVPSTLYPGTQFSQ